MITQEILFSILDYNKFSGIFTWKHNSKCAGTVKQDGYLCITFKGKKYLAHRLAWLFIYGKLPIKDIDHIDGNPLNNAIVNLREVSKQENNENIYKARSHNKLSCLGVRKKKNRYSARITVKGNEINLGSFLTQEEASKAYIHAKRNLHPFANI